MADKTEHLRKPGAILGRMLDRPRAESHDSVSGRRAFLQNVRRRVDKRGMLLFAIMGEKIKNILIGFGSALNVMPAPIERLRVPTHFKPRENDDWAAVGEDLNNAMRSVDESVDEEASQYVSAKA